MLVVMVGMVPVGYIIETPNSRPNQCHFIPGNRENGIELFSDMSGISLNPL